MRITFVLPYAGMSGGVRVVAIYAQRLQARGHEVQVISIPKAAPNVRQKVRSYCEDKAGRANPRVHRTSTAWGSPTASWRSAGRWRMTMCPMRM